MCECVVVVGRDVTVYDMMDGRQAWEDHVYISRGGRVD